MERIVGIAFVLASMLCEAFGNIAFKHAANSGETSDGLIASLAASMRHHRFIAAGLLCFAFEAVMWSLALHYLDVSQAFPISCIELIMVLFLSRIMLKEKITLQRWCGVALIVAGTILVGMS